MNREDWEARVEQAGRTLPDEVRRALLAIDHWDEWACPAHSEGSRCCLDVLLGQTAAHPEGGDYSP